jgi:hypothetical protein
VVAGHATTHGLVAWPQTLLVDDAALEAAPPAWYMQNTKLKGV